MTPIEQKLEEIEKRLEAATPDLAVHAMSDIRLLLNIVKVLREALKNFETQEDTTAYEALQQIEKLCADV